MLAGQKCARYSAPTLFSTGEQHNYAVTDRVPQLLLCGKAGTFFGTFVTLPALKYSRISADKHYMAHTFAPRCQTAPKQKLDSAETKAGHAEAEIHKAGSVEREAVAERLANTFEEAIAAVENGQQLLWLLRSTGKD
jgi:hypothetical protein